MLAYICGMVHESYSLRVKEINRETADCVSILFDIPNELKSKYSFHQGQHLTLLHPTEGEQVKRSYSICSAPYEQEVRIASKRMHGGIFSTYLNETLKVGDFVQVQIPEGRFYTDLKKDQKNLYVFFASGSGITPILSNIKHILHEEAESSILLFYGNRHTDSIIFLEALMGLKNLYPERLSLHFLLSREELEEPILNGRLQVEKLNQFAKVFFKVEEVSAFFLCGPETMLLDLREGLLRLGVPQERIHMELFGVQIQKSAPVSMQHDTGDSSRIRITLDGRKFEYQLPYNSQSILDSAMSQGARLPYACKGGVCCTCKAKLLSGEVNMLVNYGLEPDEIKNGYVLSCQSYPKTAVVELSFDE